MMNDPGEALTDAATDSSRAAALRRTAVAVLLVLSAAMLLRLVLSHPNPIRGGYDETRYLLLAEMQLDPDTVRPPRVPQFPPGWPLVIAACLAVGGTLATVHLLTLGLTGLAAGIPVWLGARRGQWLLGASIGLVFLAGRWTIRLGDSLLSEPLFACLFLVTLWAAQRDDRSLRHALWLGLLIAAGRLVRTAGIAAWPGLVVHYLLLSREPSRRRRVLAAVLVSIPMIVVEASLYYWQPNASIFSSTGYVGQGSSSPGLADVPSRFIASAADLASVTISFPRSAWHPKALFVAAGVVIAVAGLAMMIHECLWRRRPEAAIVSAYCLLVVAWSVAVGYSTPRFYWPVLPAIYFYALKAMASFPTRGERAPQRLETRPTARAVSCGVGVLLVILAASVSLWDPPLRRATKQAREAALVDALQWLDEQDGATTAVSVASYHCMRVYWLRRHWQIVSLPSVNAVDEAEASGRRWVLAENESLKLRLWRTRGFVKDYDNGRVTVLRAATE